MIKVGYSHSFSMGFSICSSLLARLPMWLAPAAAFPRRVAPVARRQTDATALGNRKPWKNRGKMMENHRKHMKT